MGRGRHCGHGRRRSRGHGEGHKYFPDLPTAAGTRYRRGSTSFLDNIYEDAITRALQKNLVTMAEIEEVIRGSFRVMIKLGLLDPPEMVPYAKIKEGPAPWTRDENKRLPAR